MQKTVNVMLTIRSATVTDANVLMGTPGKTAIVSLKIDFLPFAHSKLFNFY